MEFFGARNSSLGRQVWSGTKIWRRGVGAVLGVAVIVLGGLAAARAAESYHLLKKYSIGQAEGSTREYFGGFGGAAGIFVARHGDQSDQRG